MEHAVTLMEMLDARDARAMRQRQLLEEYLSLIHILEEEVTLEDGLARVNALREEGASLRDAVKQAAKELGLSRNELYNRAVSGKTEQ